MNQPRIDCYGTKKWYNNNNEIHRDQDKPAVIYKNGSKIWCINNELYRDQDKLAKIYNTNEKLWYKNNKIHRMRGYACYWKHLFHSNFYLWFVFNKKLNNGNNLRIIRMFITTFR